MPDLTSTGGAGLLLTAGGIAFVVALIMNGIRKAVDETTFSRWAPLGALALGAVLGVLAVVVTVNPLTGAALLGGAIMGAVGGALSQNVNTVLQRTFNPPTP